VISDTFVVQIGVIKRDTPIRYYVFAYFFVGPSSMISDSATALLAVDERLCRGYMQFPPISPGATSRVVFNYDFPSGIPLGSYIGNVFIFERIVPVSPIYDRYSIGVEVI
jgi:hypothetical protein